MDSKKKPDPKDPKKQSQVQEQIETPRPADDEVQSKHAKAAREAQVREPVEQSSVESVPDTEKAAKEASPGRGESEGPTHEEARPGDVETKESRPSQEAEEDKQAKEAREAKEAKEAPPVEQAPEGEQKATDAKGTEKGESKVEPQAGEGEKKAAEAEKKAAKGEKAGAEGAGDEKAAVEQKESGGPGGGGAADSIRWTPTDANNASVQSPVPSSLQQSETVLNAAQTAADACPNVSPQTASQPAAARPGWGSKAIGFAAGTLRSAFVGNFALWDPAVRDGLKKAFADWSDFSKAKGWDKVIAFTDHTYGIIDAILNFTGPLGTVLGIVSYARYIPIPPIPAIGSALFVVSEVLKAINFVLGIVKAVVALLRPIFTVIGMAFTKDPEKRKKYQERLAGDLIDFASSGFSVVMDAGMGGKFLKGFREARKGGMSVLGSLRKGGGGALGALRTKWSESVGLLGRNQARDLYKNTLAEAYQNAMAWRLGQRVKVTERPPSGKTTYKFQDVRKLAKSEEVFEAHTGTLLNKSRASSYVSKRSGEVLRTEYFGNKALNERLWDTGRMREVGRAVGTEVWTTVRNQAPLSGLDTAKEALKGGGGPASSAPQAGPPCAPQVQAHVDQAGKATEQSLKENQTPLLKNEPVPPKETPSAPAHLEGIKAQQEVMKTVAKAAEEHVLSAKAGQEEGKAIMEVAKEHRKGAEHAQQEAATHQQGLQKEQQDVQKGRQKVQEGQKQQQKGKEGFGKVESEGSRAKGAVPGGRVNRDEIPWYKRIYMWVVDKFEGAKAKVTEAMTGVVMKAVQGAAGFGDVGQKMQEADQQTQQQQQVLSQEPAVVQKVQSVAQKEAQAATEGEQKGAQRVADNQKAEAAGQQALQDAKKQEAALQKEEQQVQADAAKYQGTYGKSFDKLNKHADASQAGDLTPLEIQLNQEISDLQQAVSKLLAAIAQHHGQVDSAIGQNVSKFREAATQLDGERRTKAVGAAESLGAQLRGRAAQTKAERAQKAEGLVREAQAYGGKPADSAAIEAVSKLLGEALGQAQQFDQEKQSELDEMHQAFTQQYQALFQ